MISSLSLLIAGLYRSTYIPDSMSLTRAHRRWKQRHRPATCLELYLSRREASIILVSPVRQRHVPAFAVTQKRERRHVELALGSGSPQMVGTAHPELPGTVQNAEPQKLRSASCAYVPETSFRSRDSVVCLYVFYPAAEDESF